MPISVKLSAFLARTPVPTRVACFVFFAASVADAALIPFFAVWALKVAHVPLPWIGVLLGCYAGGELLVTPLLGGIADRVGRRPVLLVSTAGVGAGFVLMIFADGPVMAAVCLIAIGVFECMLHPTAATVIGDVTPPERLTGSYALLRFAANVGNMIGPALGALFALASLRYVFVGAGLSLLLATLAVAIFLPETKPSRTSDKSNDDEDEESLTALTAIFRDARLAALLLPLSLIGIASSWIESVGPLYANISGSLSETGIGLLFTYFGALGVLLQLPLSRWAQRYAAHVVILIVAAVQTIAFVFLLPHPSIVLMVAAVTALALSRVFLGPLMHTLAIEMAPLHGRATYQAAFSVASDLRDTAGPALGTWLFAAAPMLPWLIAVPATLLAGAILAAVVRRHQRTSKPSGVAP
ncbi:MAG TPA: MFS transporter [Pseudolabrys sp.]